MPRKDEITQVHIDAAAMYFEGSTQAEIAEAVGVHPSTIFRWIRDGKLDHLVQELAQDRQAAVRRRLIAKSLKAADAAIGVLDSLDDGKRLAAALAILDRTGHPKTDRVEIAGKVSAEVDVGDSVAELAKSMGGG